MTNESILTIDGEDIHVLSDSSGEEEFFVWHGYDGVNQFYPWDIFRDFGIVHRIGLPGHGPVSKSRFNLWTPDYFLDKAEKVVRRLSRSDSITLVGHSLGAFVALGVAMRLKQKVKRLILIGPMIRTPQSLFRRFVLNTPFFIPVGRMFLGGQAKRSKVSFDDMAKELKPAVSDIEALKSNPAIHNYFLQGIDDYRKQSLDALIHTGRVISRSDLRDSLQQNPIQAKTLILHGTKDKIVPSAHSEWLVRVLPNAELRLLEGAGHLGHIENEKESQNIIASWLQAALAPSQPIGINH